MEVYALIGSSGTGKSHRAQIVAHEHNIDLVIDDGLLIKGSKVIAGFSAKREATKIGAVRRALFTDAEHANVVAEMILKENPQRILILGTSEAMIRRISNVLKLDEPTQIIHIEDIATPLEINQARRVRSQRGTHVIPAPTFEVKKGFSGYLLNPLQIFLKKKSDFDEAQVIEKSVVRPTYSSLGRFFIADNVITAIASKACESSEGVAKVGKVTIDTKQEGIIIQMDLNLRYGTMIQEVLVMAQRYVKEMVEHTTALNVLAVNVTARRILLE
jgi:uncharacterized alkaline shock family protein YloU